MGGGVKKFIQPVKKNPLGFAAGLGGGLLGGVAGAKLLGGGGGGDVPQIGGKQNPLEILSSSGGAPLLTNIALGADVKSTLMGYFGASGDYNKWFNNLNESDRSAIQGLETQLTQIQTNTDLRNQAVQKLSDDFPNLMASSIPKYSAMADAVTSQMMTKAMDQISAKQAAGGAFSSGATAAAAARAGADIGMQKLQYGTGMALQDFQNQYNNANALQSFQQKMLGQGATQGFNAVQNALQRNAGIAINQAQLQANQNAADQQAQAGMWGALGQVGGMGIGAMLGGPAGAMAGGQIGSGLGSGGMFPQGQPRMNMPFNSPSQPRNSLSLY